MRNLFQTIKKSVTLKIFLMTSAMLVFTTIIVYGVIFFVLPPYYNSYKEKQIYQAVTTLTENTQSLSLEQASELLENFAKEYNVDFRIYDFEGNLVYSPSFIRIVNGNPQTEEQAPFNQGFNFVPEMYDYRVGSTNAIYMKRPIFFTNGAYSLSVNATLQPIKEASSILMQFIPYFSMLILVTAIIAGFFFSRMIAKPLIQMNKAAKKLAELDFSTRIPVESEDEIGQLSESFNEVSRNLEIALLDLQHMNEYLKEDIEKERKIEERRREFVATVSHELKSPITAVKGQLEGMIHGIGVYKDREKYLQRSFEKLEEMEALVKEMLDVSRLDRPDFTPNYKRISLTHLVEKTVAKQDYFIREKQMKLQANILQDVYVTTDENLLSKVLQNILHNAITYSGETETIRILLEDEVDQYTLSVLNTGTKIANEDIENLFRPFYRLEKSRNRNSGGSGLGLYIVKRFLDTLKLKFEMKSQPEGVEFLIYFEKTAA